MQLPVVNGYKESYQKLIDSRIYFCLDLPRALMEYLCVGPRQENLEEVVDLKPTLGRGPWEVPRTLLGCSHWG